MTAEPANGVADGPDAMGTRGMLTESGMLGTSAEPGVAAEPVVLRAQDEVGTPGEGGAPGEVGTRGVAGERAKPVVPGTPGEPRAPAGISVADAASVTAQLGRAPRAVRKVAHRCPCGLPSVVQTAPRLEDGTPFPTLYYLTCARLAARLSGLEATGRMREMTERLATDPELAAAYQRAHEAYLAERDAIVPLGTAVSAGGMPERVKCLHVHAAHALACGRGVNPFGDEALDEIGPWWLPGPCA